MSGYSRTATDSLTVSGGRECEDHGERCIKGNTNTQFREGGQLVAEVETWADCAGECRRRDWCKFWTWHHHQAGDFSRRCVVMRGFGYTVEDNNAVSGGRNC